MFRTHAMANIGGSAPGRARAGQGATQDALLRKAPLLRLDVDRSSQRSPHTMRVVGGLVERTERMQLFPLRSGPRRRPLITPKRCTAELGPSRQTRRVAANELRSRVAPRKGADLFLFSQTGISKRDVTTLIVTPHPSESHPISLSPCVDRGVVGHIDTHTHAHKYVYPPRKYFSGGACDLISAWCDDIIGRRRGP